MQAKLHEIAFNRLRNQAGEIGNAIAELDSAMTSPLVSMLPVHVMAARKYAAWQQQLAETDEAASEELKSIIGAKTRERLSGSLSEALVSGQLRTQVENDMLELISRGVLASLPQGEAD